MQVNNFCSADDSKIKKIAVLLIPVAFVLFLFNVFPYIAPSLAYKYFGDTIREKATQHVLHSFNPGDKITVTTHFSTNDSCTLGQLSVYLYCESKA